ncbi:Cardiolipin synthase [Rosistilla carotiformis]|uniref:Cardiolipin synthase n=1 Tax=Rosistilla carotiformis TaxID=2528017 RepID=A0A518JYP5_9BACT|nr:cardiolipin synthase [Rosistilla carotiformis]QDV70668.1 Cardiolipin synthase [Rosistilla carotiformis]
MVEPVSVSIAITIAHVVAATLISFRVIMRKPPVGVALAWLFLVVAVPLAGVSFYLLVGERRVGQRRARKIARLRIDYERLTELAITEGLTDVDWTSHRREAAAMNRLGLSQVGVPTVSGSRVELFQDADTILRGIAADIDQARNSVLIEFYIWNQGGAAELVLEALKRAAGRGVSCRVLVDSVGGRPWWKGQQPAELRQAGVRCRPALKAGLWRTIFARNDLRLHRKIVVVDGEVAWTGSMNLVDPKFFKQDADVGQWVDAMLRVQGGAVSPLAMTMIGDWMLETDESIDEIIRCAELRMVEREGTGDIQVIPSGPSETDDGLLQMLLALINSAHDELVLTTPYFVPDDSMVRAIRGAAGRGVKVHLVVPNRVDSVLTHFASRSYFDELLEVGVQIYLYDKGLLHTKSITADGDMAMFGTVNLDMRSLWLNYEVSLFLYGQDLTGPVRALQGSYIDASQRVDHATWTNRSLRERLLENILRLIGPVL